MEEDLRGVGSVLDFLLNQGVSFLLGVAGGLLVDRLRGLRQRRGMLRALLSEIVHNEEIMRPIRERWEEQTRKVRETWGDCPEHKIRSSALHSLKTPAPRSLNSLKTEVWHEAMRTGLPEGLFEELHSYYAPLEKLLSSEPAAPNWPMWSSLGLRSIIPNPADEERDPYAEYLQQVLEAQGKAHDRIAEYLACPWWRRLIGG